MTLRGAIASLSTGTYTVTRRAPDTRVQGRTVEGSESTFSIVASVQPVSGRELRDLPEGERGDETIVIYTVTEVRSGANPDEIEVDGSRFVIVKCERWKSFGAQHFRAYAARKDAP